MEPTLPFVKSHAFIIGINDYIHLPPLKTAVNDAKGIAERLEVQHGYQVHNPLLDADKKALESLFMEIMPSLVSAEDRVFLYFAGHGIALDGDDGPNGYIVPADAKQGDIESLIPMTQLQGALEKLPCKHVLLILDCCFAGAFRWTTGKRDIIFDLPKVIYEERFLRYVDDQAWQVITSAAYDQTAADLINVGFGSRDDGERLYSPFAKALFHALDGAGDVVPANGGDGVITASELYAYLREVVETETTEAAKRQSPSMFNLPKHGRGEFIFLHPRHKANLPKKPGRNPFMGLSPYTENDQEFFFGRNSAIRSLLDAVEKHPLTVLIGPAGQGKTSLLQAGIIPQLKVQEKEIFHMNRPGMTPLASLNELSPILSEKVKQDTTVMLVIDQYEELLQQSLDDTLINSFEETLATWLSEYPNLRILLSVRAEFEDQLPHKALKPWWKTGRLLLPEFSTEELREVISQPVLQAVMEYQPPELEDRILADTHMDSSLIPMLSFTLYEMYERYHKSDRAGRALLMEDYESLGGVNGAFKTKMEEAFIKMNESQKETLRKLMLRMLNVEDGAFLGKRVYEADLHFTSETATTNYKIVADFLVNQRLIKRPKDRQDNYYLEPAYAGLMGAWDQLKLWAEEIGEERLKLNHKLNQSAWEFQYQTEKNPSLSSKVLWDRNPHLKLFKNEIEKPESSINVREENFILKSIRKKKARNIRLISTVTTVLLVFAGMAFSVYYINNQWKETQNSELAKSLSATARQQEYIDPSIALNLAFAAYKTDPSKETVSAVHDIWSKHESMYTHKLMHDNTVSSVAFSHDGSQILTASHDRSLRIWNRKNGEEIQRLDKDLPYSTIFHASYSPDNTWVLARCYNSWRIFDVAKNSLAYTFSDTDTNYTAMTFSPDSRFILAASESDSTLKKWDFQTNEWKPAFDSLRLPATKIRYSPKGRYLAVQTDKEKLFILDGVTGDSIWSFKPHNGTISDFIFSPDESMLLTSSYIIINTVQRSGAKLWDLKTGENLYNFSTLKSTVSSLAFSPDGNKIITGSYDHTASLWEKKSKKRWREVRKFQGYFGWISSVAFSPDGNQVLIGSWDHTAKLVDIKIGQAVQSFEGHDEYIESLAYSKDARQILTGSLDKKAILWDVESGRSIYTLSGHTGAIIDVALSPNGKYALTGSYDDSAILWDLQTGTSLDTFRCEEDVQCVAFSPDSSGCFILAGTDDNRTYIWDRETKDTVQIFVHEREDDEFSVNDAEFSPDGKKVLIGAGHFAQIWDIGSAKEIRSIPIESLYNEVWTVSYSPDERYLLAGSKNDAAILWDIVADSLILNIPSEEGAFHAVAFSPDGSQFALGTFADGDRSDGTHQITLWDFNTLTPLLSFSHSDENISSLAFSPDGKFLLSGSRDKTAKLWDISMDWDPRIYKFNEAERLKYKIEVEY